MVSLEQVKLLETKVARAIEYVERVTSENIGFAQRESELLAKLEASQKRTEELEALVLRFKEDQSRIEDGILSALERLSQFEDAIEKSLEDKPDSKTAKSSSAKPSVKTGDGLLAKSNSTTDRTPAESKSGQPASPSSDEMFFEIPEEETEEDIAEDLDDEDEEPKSKDSELDIF